MFIVYPFKTLISEMSGIKYRNRIQLCGLRLMDGFSKRGPSLIYFIWRCMYFCLKFRSIQGPGVECQTLIWQISGEQFWASLAGWVHFWAWDPDMALLLLFPVQWPSFVCSMFNLSTIWNTYLDVDVQLVKVGQSCGRIFLGQKLTKKLFIWILTIVTSNSHFTGLFTGGKNFESFFWCFEELKLHTDWHFD